MPLRFVRVKVPRIDSQDVLHIATTATALTKELSSMSFFPPATAAVSILLLILQTVQSVQNNKEACFRLARRSARILLDINEQMEGRWDTAPPTLIRNLKKFQDTLGSIHEFMKTLTDATWVRRFTKKSTIENAIIDYTAQLDDASQSFQIATLIDIHYAVTSSRTKELRRTILEPVSPPPPPYQSPGDLIQSSNGSTSSVLESEPLTFVESPVDTEENRALWTSGSTSQSVSEEEYELISDDVLEARGFPRYHQSEVRLKGRANLKGGWWTATSPAEVAGRPALIKRYEGPVEQALKAWMKDVKLLQNVFHPNLPQMVGLSERGAPTPFIVLSHVQTRTPQALIFDILKKDGLAACTSLILHFYQDIVDAALYIQRQRGLDDHGLQDFVADASFRVDGSNTMIMGLPAPKNGHWLTFRSYGLTESLKMAIMDMLPKGGTMQYEREDTVDNRDTIRRIDHLVVLTKGLLPAEKAPINLSNRVRNFIDNEEENDDFSLRMPRKPNLSLRQLRLSNIDADAHNHTWNENGGIPSHKFAVGDYGYIPDNGKNFQDFIVLGNILREGLAKFAINHHARGVHWCWNDTPIHHEPMEPFPLPGDATCWTLVVLPHGQVDCQIIHSSSFERVADAWRFLLLHGRDIAMKHNINPEELVLITQSGTNQDFYIRDFDTQPPRVPRPPLFHRHPAHQPVFGGGFDNPGYNRLPHMLQARSPFPNNPPAIMYLITSPTPRFEPYWSHHPVLVPQGTTRPALNRGWTYKIGWSTGFIGWIQLHPEDFAE